MKACAICGCTEAQPCPGGCSWSTSTAGPPLFPELEVMGPAPPRPLCTACVALKDELGRLLTPWFLGLQGRSVAPSAVVQATFTALCLLPNGPRVRLDRWAWLSSAEDFVERAGLEFLARHAARDQADLVRELGALRTRLLELLELIGGAGREPLSWVSGVALGLGGKLLDWSESARRKLGIDPPVQVPENTEPPPASSPATASHGFPSDPPEDLDPAAREAARRLITADAQDVSGVPELLVALIERGEGRIYRCKDCGCQAWTRHETRTRCPSCTGEVPRPGGRSG